MTGTPVYGHSNLTLEKSIVIGCDYSRLYQFSYDITGCSYSAKCFNFKGDFLFDFTATPDFVNKQVLFSLNKTLTALQKQADNNYWEVFQTDSLANRTLIFDGQVSVRK